VYGIDIDLTTIAAIWMGGVVLLVPLVGLVARFAVAPLLDSVARLRRAGSAPADAELSERFDRLELELARLAGAVQRLSERETAGYQN